MPWACRSPHRLMVARTLPWAGHKPATMLPNFFSRIGVTIFSLRSQVTAYRATLLDRTLTNPTRMKQAPVDALYVVWGGANDLREAVRQGTRACPGPDSQRHRRDIVDIIRTLQSAGAIYFLVPNRPIWV